MVWVFLMAAGIIAADIVRKRVRHYRLMNRMYRAM